jgi:hypothetical protein
MTQKLNIETWGKDILRISEIIYQNDYIVLIKVELSEKWSLLNESQDLNNCPHIEINSGTKFKEYSHLTFLDYQNWDIFSCSVNKNELFVTLINYSNLENINYEN